MDREIVIKIPEEEYEEIINSEDCGLHILTRAIAKGTPLPKGHGRLIDISEYEDNYFNVAIKYDDGDHTHEKYTFALPTIIEADKERTGDGQGSSN